MKVFTADVFVSERDQRVTECDRIIVPESECVVFIYRMFGPNCLDSSECKEELDHTLRCAKCER